MKRFVRIIPGLLAALMLIMMFTITASADPLVIKDANDPSDETNSSETVPSRELRGLRITELIR